jgi:hypothetical protein
MAGSWLELLDQSCDVLKQDAHGNQPAGYLSNRRIQFEWPDDAHGVYQCASNDHGAKSAQCSEHLAHRGLL